MKKLTLLAFAHLATICSFSQILSDGYYVITLADGGKALDADAAGMNSNDGKIHLLNNNGSATQVWYIHPVSVNSYSITLTASGKALDADGPGMYTDGGKVHLWDKRNDGYKTQSWKINFAGNNSFSIVLADGGKAIDAGISTMYQNDGLVHLWSYNGGKTQKWIFSPAVPNLKATTTIASLSTMSATDFALWSKAINDQQGIIGNDYRGFEDIGSACFERASNNLLIPDNLNFWYPQHQTSYQPTNLEYYKRTLVGVVENPQQSQIAGTFQDYDVNIDLIPTSKYAYMVTESHPREYTTIMSAEYYGSLKDEGQKDCNDPESIKEFTYLEVETAPDYWPQGDHLFGRSILTDMALNQTGDTMCVYGPWIYDKGHCCHPEIHPAEELWWQKNVQAGKQFACNVVADASKRFWWRDQMDDGTKIRPWGAPPVRGLFAIAFQVALAPVTTSDYSYPRFDVSNVEDYNVIEYSNTNQTFNLLYQNKILASFVPHNNAFKVSYEKVGLLPGSTNIIGGFLVIETSVGTCTQMTTSLQIPNPGSAPRVLTFPPGTNPDRIDQAYEKLVFKKVEGHYFFNVNQTTVKVRNIHTQPLPTTIKKSANH